MSGVGASKGIFEFGPRWDTESTHGAPPGAIRQTECRAPGLEREKQRGLSPGEKERRDRRTIREAKLPANVIII